ncbi:hypothetical protein ACQEU8_00030 [Streptomyces sp. CA-250714]|uniref:hypothetical protein n=1 Tax=Streptomyces sp. CA-250714 TaxID=3240060 RepID=UPI003D8C8414
MLPFEPREADYVTAGGHPPRGFIRSKLMRAARSYGDQVREHAHRRRLHIRMGAAQAMSPQVASVAQRVAAQRGAGCAPMAETRVNGHTPAQRHTRLGEMLAAQGAGHPEPPVAPLPRPAGPSGGEGGAGVAEAAKPLGEMPGALAGGLGSGAAAAGAGLR